jgi:uncharacterized membrane protein (UPF0127 family)
MKGLPRVKRDIAGIAIAVSLLSCMGISTYIAYAEKKEIEEYPHSATIETSSGIKIATVEIQVSKEGQKKGLSYRNSIEPGSGMLFPVQPAKLVEVWMHDMKFPLDILFVKDNQVIQVVENAPPCKATETCPRYLSNAPVDRVIELHTDSKVNVGTKLKIKYSKSDKE